jgi:hypothetical protein
MVLPIRPTNKARNKRSSPSRANNKKRSSSRKHIISPKQYHNLLSCAAITMASIAALFCMTSTLLLLSQLNCFNTHFGLPKSITNTRVTHNTSNGNDRYGVELRGSTGVTLDDASKAMLQAHAKSGGAPLQLNMNIPSILNVMNGDGRQPIPVSYEQIQNAIFSQIPPLEPTTF